MGKVNNRNKETRNLQKNVEKSVYKLYLLF